MFAIVLLMIDITIMATTKGGNLMFRTCDEWSPVGRLFFFRSLFTVNKITFHTKFTLLIVEQMLHFSLWFFCCCCKNIKSKMHPRTMSCVPDLFSYLFSFHVQSKLVCIDAIAEYQQQQKNGLRAESENCNICAKSTGFSSFIAEAPIDCCALVTTCSKRIRL